MLSIPESFLTELEQDFHGRLRVRWSHATQQWHIEQKVGRQKAPHRKISPLDDRAIRWKDGFEFLLAVTPGDHTQCPHCDRRTKVPVLEMKYAKCEHCRKDFRACYWPLGPALLQHLRYTDPYRGGSERAWEDMEKGELQHDLTMRRGARNEREAIIKDNFNQLFEIQSVGYTGKEFRGA